MSKINKVKGRKFNSVLLLKLPYCTHPDALKKDENFRTKACFRPVPSLALASLCAFIDKYKTFNYRLKAIDLNIEAYTEPSTPIDTHVYPDLLQDCIKNNTYDVLALSTMFVFNEDWVESAVKISRKLHPEAKIIIGGGYPTLFPRRCLENHDIDDAVIGEGETAFLHILNKYNQHRDVGFENKFPLEGFATKNENNKIIIFPERLHFLDLSELPPPAWQYLNVENYFKNSGDVSLPIEGSRGCPYRCTYCCTYLSWGRRVRYKPVKNLIDEILQTKNRYSIQSMAFIDDNLSFSKEWIKDFLTRIINMQSPIKLMASNFSVKHLDEEIVDLLSEAGFDEIGIAVESGSGEIQERINKNINFNKVKELVNIMKSRNIYITVCWMIGFPKETIEQINSTFNFARELRAHTNQFLTVLPYPGTELFDEAKSANLLVFQEDDLSKFDNRKCDYLKSNEWSYDRLQEMIYDVNIELNFLNNPLLDTKSGMNTMLKFLENLLLRLPEHIIARIIIGYIYKQKNMKLECEEYYNSAIDLLKEKSLKATFNKYLFWKHSIINDFNQYFSARRLSLSEVKS